jgi:hypothetical protein
MSKTNSKSNLSKGEIPIHNVSFILVNLSEHTTEFASAVLQTLCSLPSKYILIINDESTIDFSQWSKNPTTIFTTAEFASTVENLPKNFQMFLLDKGKNNIEQQRFASIDDLICRLADQIIQKYRLEANDNTKAEEHDKQIKRIYRELRQIHEKFIINKSPIQTTEIIAPILFWLIPNTKNNEDANYIVEKLGNYFSSCCFFSTKDDYHHYISKNKTTDLFVIISSSYQQSITEDIRQFANAKYVYHYGESENDDETIFDRDNLRYHLTYDLMDYYGKLGEQYRRHNQPKKAREMFLKAQTLCQCLSTDCFPFK